MSADLSANEARALRKRKGWTQARLAQVLEVSVRTVKRMEGRPHPTKRDRLALLGLQAALAHWKP